MRYLRGSFIVNGISINVRIMLIEPTEYRLEEWSGEGRTKNYINPGQYETSIGTIIITNILNRKEDFFVEFLGSGQFRKEGLDGDK